MTASLGSILAACRAADPPAPAPAPAPTTAPAAATTVVPTPTPTPTVVAVSTIAMTALEDGEKYSYDPAKITMKTGEVTVSLANKAGNKWPHTISVKNAAGTEVIRSARVQPGASLDVKFTLPDAGVYQILCVQMGHADMGQTGTITAVRG